MNFKAKSLTLLLCLVFITKTKAAFEGRPLNARYVACAKLNPYNPSGNNSFYNPAHILINKNNFSFSYNNRFFIKGLNSGAIEYSHKFFENYGAGLFFGKTGNKLYSENFLEISQAIKTTKNSFIGLSTFWNFQQHSKDYAQSQTLGLNLGYFINLPDNYYFSINLLNPLYYSFPYKLKQNSSLVSSVGLNFSNHGLISGYKYNSIYNNSFHLAFIFSVVEELSIYIGSATSPVTANFGIEITKNKLRILLASEYNFKITSSSFLTISYDLP